MTRIQLANNSVTIKSMELVEIINQFRQLEGNRKELRHDSFITKIKKELETLKKLGINNDQNILEVKYRDKKGELRPCYELNRDGMLQMLNSESPVVRYKTIEYINKLEQELKAKESEPQFKLPTTYKEALIELVATIEEKERIEAEKERLIHSTKTYTATELAKELGFKSAQAFNEELKERKIQYKINNTWVLCARYSDKGYQSIKQIELDNGKVIYDRRFNGNGRDWLLNEVFSDR